MLKNHSLMNQADDGTQGGAAGDVVATHQEPSALTAGQTDAGSDSPNGWLPEKYRVNRDGALDIEASARKIAEAHRHLEQRLGSGDIPPKTSEDYDLTGLPDTIKIEDLKGDPEMQSFLKSAHGKGLTNDQVSFVINEYMQRAPKLVESGINLTTEEVTQTLKGVWASDADYGQNISHAYNAASTIANKAGISFEELERSGLGNHPVFIRLMASIGPELAEDVPPNSVQGVTSGDFDAQAASIRANPAYSDIRHPEHKQVMQRMEALYTRRHGTKPQRLFSGVGH